VTGSLKHAFIALSPLRVFVNALVQKSFLSHPSGIAEMEESKKHALATAKRKHNSTR
jgi:hypothetical protein